MAQVPPIVIATPADVSTVRVTVKRSWKARGLILVNTALAFVLAFLGYVQTINLANLGLTADRALFWMTVVGLAQFALLQIRPFVSATGTADPAPPGGQG